ncbi:MAG: sigma-70 family RNA polymerase sigma factor [bacterium]
MEDIELVERYIKGEKGAMEGLIIKYQKQVYSIAFRMLNNIEDAKDMVQETFLRAIKGIKSFNKKASFKTWLYRIAINTSLNHLKERRHKDIGLNEEIAESKNDTLSEIIEDERWKYIKSSLERLPERQRLALILRLYEGLSCKEAAEAMKCSEGALKAHYHQAIRKIRGFLRKNGYEIKG